MVDFLRPAAKRVRDAALLGFRVAGGFRWVANSAWRRERLLVLCYHGVSQLDEHEWDPELFVTSDFLRRRFEILRDRGYKVLPLGEAITRCANGTLPPRSIALTFDDGLSDFAQIVAPMLLEFGFPATVYVTTYYSEKQWPVTPPILNYVMWKAGERLLSFEWPEAGVGAGPTEEVRARRRRLLVHLTRFANEKGLSGEQRWALTQGIAEKLAVDLREVRERRVLHIMTAEEIQDVAAKGIDVQLHTHRHRVPRDPARFDREIIDNRVRLERLTGQAAEHFCYPSGEVFQECLPWLRRLGVRSATTCEPGLYSAAVDPLLMPRFIDTYRQTETVFESWLSGTSATLRPRSRSPLPAGMDSRPLKSG